MCGRYVSATSPDVIADYFGATIVSESFADSNYNVAPTASVPVIVEHDGNRSLTSQRWGLVPSWAKSIRIGAKMINARSETVAQKSAFRAAIKRRRCVIPADAFYEWTATVNPADGKPMKQPWCITRTDGELFAFAGIFEVWRDPELADDAPKLFSCAILTTGANTAMSKVHDRMPVMVAPHLWDAWIDRDDGDGESLLSLLEPIPDALISIHAVSTAVNNSRSSGAELMNPVAIDEAQTCSQGQLL